jgi:hypothetical protein
MRRCFSSDKACAMKSASQELVTDCERGLTSALANRREVAGIREQCCCLGCPTAQPNCAALVPSLLPINEFKGATLQRCLISSPFPTVWTSVATATPAAIAQAVAIAQAAIHHDRTPQAYKTRACNYESVDTMLSFIISAALATVAAAAAGGAAQLNQLETARLPQLTQRLEFGVEGPNSAFKFSFADPVRPIPRWSLSASPAGCLNESEV